MHTHTRTHTHTHIHTHTHTCTHTHTHTHTHIHTHTYTHKHTHIHTHTHTHTQTYTSSTVITRVLLILCIAPYYLPEVGSTPDGSQPTDCLAFWLQYPSIEYSSSAQTRGGTEVSKVIRRVRSLLHPRPKILCTKFTIANNCDYSVM